MIEVSAEFGPLRFLTYSGIGVFRGVELHFGRVAAPKWHKIKVANI